MPDRFNSQAIRNPIPAKTLRGQAFWKKRISLPNMVGGMEIGAFLHQGNDHKLSPLVQMVFIEPILS